jgi:carboxypeptidase family protein
MTFSRLLAAFLAIAAAAAPVAAQTLDRGEITGTVRDESGAVLPGVTVTVTETSTGFSRAVVSNGAGQFTAPLLPVGEYRVRGELQGFGGAESVVRIAVGQALNVNLEMKVASVTQQIEVVGDANAGTAASTVVGEHAIANLPINGRDYRDFALLAPTAQSTTGTRGTFRVGGQPGDYLALHLDGADFTNNFFGEFFGSLETKNFTVPMEAVQEFQVTAGGFGAELGRSNGGLVNVVTKSGSNNIRGSGAYFLRHHSLTADDAFGNPPTGLVRHQFGGSIGGPLVANKSFYFVAADIQNQETPVTVKFSRNVAGIAVPELGIADLHAFEGQFPRNEDLTTILGKFDHSFSSEHRLSSRVNYTRNKGTNMAGGSLILARAVSNLESFKNQGVSWVSSLSSSFGTRLFAETKGQFSFENRPRLAQGDGPQVQITDTGTFGGSSSLPATQDMYRYQASENVNYLVGRHTFKAGGDYNGFNMRNNSFALSLHGAYVFPTLEAFIARNASQYSQNFGLNGSTAEEAALLESFWQHEVSAYIQDQYRPSSKLTVLMGLRYDAQFNPAPDAGTAGVRVALGAPHFNGTAWEQTYGPVPQDIPDDTNNFSPRLEAHYDLDGTGATLLKGGVGYYYGRTPMIYFPVRGSGINNSTIFSTPARFGITFPQVLPGTIPPGSALEALIPKPAIQYVDPDFQNPRVLNVNASVTRRLAAGLSAEAGYLFSDSENLRIGGFRSTFWDRNLNPSATVDQFGRSLGLNTVVRPDTTITTANAMASLGHGRYHAMLLELTRPLANGWQAYASYTLASNKSNSSTERDTEASFGPSDPFNLDLDYGYNEMDVRHSFKAYALGTLPWDILVASTWTATSGLAFPAYSSADVNGDAVRNNGLNPDRPVVDGELLPRFPYHQPSTFTWDFRVSKAIKFKNSATYQLMLEVFNLLNNDNLFSDTRTNATFGTPTFRQLNRTLGPRIAQIGMRIDF